MKSLSKLLKKIIHIKTLIIIIALFIVLVFSLHAIHFTHDHPEEIFGTEIQAVMHNSDKKWWLLLITLSFISSVRAVKLVWKTSDSSKKLLINKTVLATSLIIAKLFDPLSVALKKGILHSKIYPGIHVRHC